MDYKIGLAGLLAAGAVFLYKRYAPKYLKKWFDDPSTPEDESKQIINLGEHAVKIAVQMAVAKALDEAKKNPKIDAAAKATELLVGQMAGQISEEDAKKLVSAALAKK